MISADSLNVVALISGGKDSFFSILHCLKNGHKVIALANLYPAPPEPSSSDIPHGLSSTKNDEEIDSHMYQTVGASILPLYAEALNLPLYRAPINGTAHDHARSYSSTGVDSDETESLLPLLTRVKAAHPTLNAVSTGAILSDYQRTRIESVAVRLGLTPLGFLWQYPYLPPYEQASLLRDMAAVGQDARIIKVASGGLDERYLWLNVADELGATLGKLVREMERFGGLVGGAVLGEGGEYETLALDGPVPVWKRRIMVEEGEREVLRDGGVWSLRMSRARTEEKAEQETEEEQDNWMTRLRVPDMWDVEFKHVLQHLESAAGGSTEEVRPTTQRPDSIGAASQPIHDLQTTTTFTKSILYISNLHSAPTTLTTSNRTITDQIHSITHAILSILTQHNLTPASIAFTTILLRHMSDFAAINAIYSTLFTTANPPARVTVACGDALPIGVDIVLSLTVHIQNPPSDRLGLHVQSRSYWAPANIGPYSQAIGVPIAPTSTASQVPHGRIIYIAGQIPLVPGSMTLVPGSFTTQAVLSLEHLWRIGRVMAVDCWASCVVFITANNLVEARRRAEVALEAWKCAHELRDVDESQGEGDGSDEDEEEPDIDIAELSLRRPWAVAASSVSQSMIVTPNPKTERRALPNRKVLHPSSLLSPPCFVAEVAELPRGASIEWAALGLNAADQQSHVRHLQDREAGISTSWVSTDRFSITTCTVEDAKDLKSLLEEIARNVKDEGRLVEVYTAGWLPEERCDWETLNVEVVPCRSVWGVTAERVYAAVRYRNFVVGEV